MFFYYEADSSDPVVAAALGTLYGAGNTSFVRLNGTGGTNFTSWTSQNSPVPADEWTNIWTGQNVAFAKNKNNQIYVWGYDNRYGYYGLGDTTARNTPTLFTGSQNFVDMQGGDYHSVAVDSSGQLWTAGYNHRGQLGLGNTTNRSSWTQVTEALDASGNTISLPTISKVFAVYHQTLVLTTDGDVYSCGEGSEILGRNYSTTNNKLKFVVGGVAKMSVSKNVVGAVKTDGTLIRWGIGYDYWYVGGGKTPNVLSSVTNWTHIAASYWGFAAVNSNNELYFIGTNYGGEFAGIWPIQTKVNTLTKLTSWSGGAIEDIQFSGYTSNDTLFIRTSDKKLYVSGEGSSGQLGLGTTSDRNSLAESATGVIDFSMGSYNINWIIKE